MRSKIIGRIPIPEQHAQAVLFCTQAKPEVAARGKNDFIGETVRVPGYHDAQGASGRVGERVQHGAARKPGEIPRQNICHFCLFDS